MNSCTATGIYSLWMCCNHTQADEQRHVFHFNSIVILRIFYTVGTASIYSKSVDWNQNIQKSLFVVNLWTWFQQIVHLCLIEKVTDEWRHIRVKSSPCSRRLPVKTYINSFHRMALHTKAHKGVTLKKRIVTRMTTQQTSLFVDL